ncbi:NINE protein [Timonella sp. A28]|uniref:TM2 domain-containing protein n=1 Tax=Timonella sp. A28 TaxID=3442640 RepID=UPI003EBE2C07
MSSQDQFGSSTPDSNNTPSSSPENPTGQYGNTPYTQPEQTPPGQYGAPPAGGYYSQQQDQYGQYQQPYGAQQQGYNAYGQSYVNQKSKVVAGILGILLGVFGVHNFYLGNTGKAIAQLLITLLSFGALAFVSFVWGLIEGILILVSNPGDPWHRDASGMELRD